MGRFVNPLISVQLLSRDGDQYALINAKTIDEIVWGERMDNGLVPGRVNMTVMDGKDAENMRYHSMQIMSENPAALDKQWISPREALQAKLGEHWRDMVRGEDGLDTRGPGEKLVLDFERSYYFSSGGKGTYTDEKTLNPDGVVAVLDRQDGMMGSNVFSLNENGMLERTPSGHRAAHLQTEIENLMRTSEERQRNARPLPNIVAAGAELSSDLQF